MSLPIFVDASAFVALLDDSDERHSLAGRIWRELVAGTFAGTRTLVSHHPVVVETSALLARRCAFEAQRALFHTLLPRLQVVYVTEELHVRASSAYLAASRRRLSFTDCLSFEVMRSERIRHAFAWDRHFAEQGFPSPPEMAAQSGSVPE